MSIRLEIVQRSIVKLNTSRPGAVPEARLRRPLPIDAGNVPAAAELNLYFSIEDMRPATNRSSSPLTKKELSLIVESRVPIKDATKIEEELEPIHSWVEKVLSGENLDGYIHMITPVRLQWVPVFLDKIYAISLFRFLVEYQTARDNPDAIQ